MRSGLCLQLDANERIRNVTDFNLKEEALLIPPNSVPALCSEAELGVFTAERERTPGGLPFWATGEPPFAVWQADGTDEDGSLPKGENSPHVIQDFSVKKQFRRSELWKELSKPDEMDVSVLGSRSDEQEENSCGKTRRSGKADTGETHDTTKSKTKKCS